LIPTKATLFGLDVRFRAIDKKLEEEKGKLIFIPTTLNLPSIARRNAFKI
jgi:hypothetical protein